MEDTDTLVFEDLSGVSWLDTMGIHVQLGTGCGENLSQVGHSWQELLAFLALSKALSFPWAVNKLSHYITESH